MPDEVRKSFDTPCILFRGDKPCGIVKTKQSQGKAYEGFLRMTVSCIIQVILGSHYQMEIKSVKAVQNRATIVG